jgi:hypothetical protein
MATVEVKNLADLNDIHKLLLHHLAVLNRKMRENRFGSIGGGLPEDGIKKRWVASHV